MFWNMFIKVIQVELSIQLNCHVREKSDTFDSNLADF
uniref:Uncharacterized protein n=1 Tax=Spodoptera littoralis nuclear polyhedrosis virus TaxID=10456 RepID=A0A3G4S8W9_NPVSL|nr:hypothetical protein [Spodoptera littoralis nucleopolyhedrovirus]